MYCKTLIGVAILAATTLGAGAEGEPADQPPKPTLTDVRHLADEIAGDKSKLESYCSLGKLHDEMQQAVENNDLHAIDALTERINTLERTLGPEYDRLIDGLDQIDLNTAEGQHLADVFKSLQDKCE
jgi:flagellar motility protein MotE (MotC chaperone)